MRGQHRIPVHRGYCACVIVACVLLLPGCDSPPQRPSTADYYVPYGTAPAGVAGSATQPLRGSRNAIPAPTIVIPVQGSRLALQGSAIPLGQRSSGSPMLVLVQPPSPRAQAAATPPRAAPSQPLPGARYFAPVPPVPPVPLVPAPTPAQAPVQALARAAPAVIRTEVRPIPAAFSVPLGPPVSAAISAAISPPVGASIGAPLSPLVSTPINPPNSFAISAPPGLRLSASIGAAINPPVSASSGASLSPRVSPPFNSPARVAINTTPSPRVTASIAAPSSAPISPPINAAFGLSLRGFGEAEAAAVRYAGGPCSQDIYRLAWNAADLFDLQPVTIAALIEVESGCRNDAVSDVGARGLMQLMPATGARAAYRYLHGTDHEPSLAELHDPATNIQLGAAYVGLLQDHYKFIDSPRTRQILVVAAYNCGPDFIDQRLPQQAHAWSESQALQWVHGNTPEETRGFVDSVLQKAAVYGNAASIARAAATFTSGKDLSP
jgi:soluble lytic murein transglycosylase-like protein